MSKIQTLRAWIEQHGEIPDLTVVVPKHTTIAVRNDDKRFFNVDEHYAISEGAADVACASFISSPKAVVEIGGDRFFLRGTSNDWSFFAGPEHSVLDLVQEALRFHQVTICRQATK